MAAPCGGSACCRVLPLLMTSCFSRLQNRARPAARRQWGILSGGQVQLVRVWVTVAPTNMAVTPSTDSFSSEELGRITTAASSARRADQGHLLCDHHMPCANETMSINDDIHAIFIMPTWRRSSGGQQGGVAVPLVQAKPGCLRLLLLACILVVAKSHVLQCRTAGGKARGSCFKWNGGALHRHSY